VFRRVVQGDADEPGVQIRLSGQEADPLFLASVQFLQARDDFPDVLRIRIGIPVPAGSGLLVLVPRDEAAPAGSGDDQAFISQGGQDLAGGGRDGDGPGVVVGAVLQSAFLAGGAVVGPGGARP
jgi:hypothetical protein